MRGGKRLAVLAHIALTVAVEHVVRERGRRALRQTGNEFQRDDRRPVADVDSTVGAPAHPNRAS